VPTIITVIVIITNQARADDGNPFAVWRESACDPSGHRPGSNDVDQHHRQRSHPIESRVVESLPSLEQLRQRQAMDVCDRCKEPVFAAAEYLKRIRPQLALAVRVPDPKFFRNPNVVYEMASVRVSRRIDYRDRLGRPNTARIHSSARFAPDATQKHDATRH
jgi:hypothetical protein